VLALASLLATTVGFVSAIAVLDSNGIGGASPEPSVLLSVALMDFAALPHVQPAAAGKSRQWPTVIAVDVTNYPNRTKRS
jgi:hypothetical protein